MSNAYFVLVSMTAMCVIIVQSISVFCCNGVVAWRVSNVILFILYPLHPCRCWLFLAHIPGKTEID
jgi:hypothetical protein